jgi:hypothetical protein
MEEAGGPEAKEEREEDARVENVLISSERLICSSFTQSCIFLKLSSLVMSNAITAAHAPR